MSTQTQTGTASGTPTLTWWQAGIVGGLVGGVVFGAIMHLQLQAVLEFAIPEGMYGFGDGLAVGWALHLLHAVVLGVVFVAVVEHTALDDVLSDNRTNAIGGLAYGLLTWGLLAMVVMPIWVTGEFDAAPADFESMSLLGHLLFGTVVGLVYSVLVDQ